MKKFKFKLQAVLNAREKELENRQLVLAEVQNKLNEQQKHLDYLNNKLNTSKKNLEQLLEAGSNIDIIQISTYQNYIVKLEDNIKNQLKLITDTEVELEQKKQEVLEALKAKSILEKLKEKKLEEFKKNIEKLDLLEIDEIATNRHNK